MGPQVQAGGFTPDCFTDLILPAGTPTYTALDHVTSTATAADVTPLKFPACREANGSGVITGGRMLKSSDTTAVSSFRLWLFTQQPFAAGSYPADDAAITFTYASLLNSIGYIDFATFTDEGSCAYCDVGLMNQAILPFSLKRAARNETDDYLDQSGIARVPGNRLLYGMLQAKAAYIRTASETIRIWLSVQQD